MKSAFRETYDTENVIFSFKLPFYSEMSVMHTSIDFWNEFFERFLFFVYGKID